MSTGPARTVPTRAPLWLALHFPRLPIDLLEHRAADGDDTDGARALAIVVRHASSRRVMACNDAASDAGIVAGLALDNAYALVPDLHISPFDADAQADQLDQLTLWALGVSSRVTPCPPDGLLLEIGASLRLFGGLKSLLVHVREALTDQGVTASRGVAPTPAAARLFARVGQSRPVIEHARLTDVLGMLPVARLPLEPSVLDGLQRSGIRRLDALMALPARALARRFGSVTSDWLYRLDGRLPDPQTAWQAPQRFDRALDLPLEAPDTAALGFVLNRLLGALGGFLVGNDLGVRELEMQLYHHRLPPTRVTLRFLDATADTAHLLRIARERLAGTALQAPVVRVGLSARELGSVQRQANDLFDGASPGSGSVSGSGHAAGVRTGSRGIEQVLDRLSARLGRQAVYTAMPGDDHRPEKAWRPCPPGERTVTAPGQASWQASEQASGPAPCQARPLWLYPEPVEAPAHLRPTTLPERIENGWWGDADVRRDYYIARDAAGSHFWVFRQRGGKGDVADTLWVHGLFA